MVIPTIINGGPVYILKPDNLIYKLPKDAVVMRIWIHDRAIVVRRGRVYRTPPGYRCYLGAHFGAVGNELRFRGIKYRYEWENPDGERAI